MEANTLLILGNIILTIYLFFKINQIMPTLQELVQKADELQTALDAEQAQIAEVISGLEQANAALQELVAEGGTAEERQALADKLTAITEDLKSTIPDSTEPVEPEPEA